MSGLFDDMADYLLSFAAADDTPDDTLILTPLTDPAGLSVSFEARREVYAMQCTKCQQEIPEITERRFARGEALPDNMADYGVLKHEWEFDKDFPFPLSAIWLAEGVCLTCGNIQRGWRSERLLNNQEGRAQRRKYYRAGIKAVWNSLDPHADGACYAAWTNHPDYGWLMAQSDFSLSDRALIEFAWGWRWAEDRFKDSWLGVPPGERGVDMAVLWR